jgi:hypothetical protein
MNDDAPLDDQLPDPPASGKGPESLEIRHSQLSALVPEHVRRGVFSTGAVVLQGPHEFIIDFLLRMTRPHLVSARVVMAPQVVGRLIAALRENLQNYERTFGTLPGTQPLAASQQTGKTQASPAAASLPGPVVPSGPASPPAAEGAGATQDSPGAREPAPVTVSDQSTTAQDLYDQLKLPEDVMSGAYANAVMIGHTATEFSFDFITTFFPRSAVSCRVYMASPNARRFLDSLAHSYEQFQRKARERRQPPDPPAA